MNTKHVELLRKLEQFQLDSPEASLPFSARLARENHWTTGHATRVIGEYKRFAFLSVAAGHPVSPPEDVDQAWHLHLTYSENYWKIFCPQILGQPLHHQPTQGGATESNKFDDWYSRTLESYKTFFGETPPPDIWPAPEIRRREKHNFTRVDRERNWVIPKPRLRAHLARFAPLLLAALLVFCTGSMLAQGANPLDWRGPEFLIFYAVLFAVCFGAAIILRQLLRVPGSGRLLAKDEIDGYSIAYLHGGPILTVNTAIANLIHQSALQFDKRTRHLSVLIPGAEPANKLERIIYLTANRSGGVAISDVRDNAQPVVTAIADDLKTRGLVMTNNAARKTIILPLLLAFAAVAFGVIKIFVGVSRDKPVGFLIALCILTGIISLIVFARRPARSRYGDSVLKNLQARHPGPHRLGRHAAVLPAAEFAMLIGLFGMTALAGSELSDLPRSLRPPPSTSGCGGCGGGGH